MKTLITLTLIIFGFRAHSQPVANAGPDQTIYLTQTSTVTLDGSGSSGDSYQWTDITANIGYPMLMDLGIEGHPTNTGTITSPSSKTATVTGLSQGTWYYQIAVTTGATTVYDTMVVRVNYDVPPGAYSRGLEMDNPTVLNFINSRNDTNQIPSGTSYGLSTSQGKYYYDRSRSNSMYIDNLKGKFYSVVEDGYHWFASNSYARTEVAYGGYGLDTTKTYCLEWKGYLPQDLYSIIPHSSSNSAALMLQLHTTNPNISNGPTWEFDYDGLGNLVFIENMANYNGQNATPTFPKINVRTTVMSIGDLYNHTHTIRVTTRQGAGYPGQDAFIKVEIDGVQKYYRNTGQVGESPLNQDYPKFATIYDWNNSFVSPSNHVRNRKIALVTEDFNIYTLNDGYNQSPAANAGSDKIITLPTNSVTLSGSGSDADGTIASYLWTKISGPSGGTIAKPNSASTSVSALVQGVYQFQLTVTDNKGSTGKSTMQVTVNSSSNQPPTASAGGNQSITLPTNSISLTGSGNDSDGTISSYLWTKISGPSTYTIVNPSSSATNVTDLVQGNYTFQLKVTDNGGAIGIDTIHITVNAVINILPTANAGSNQSINLPTNSVNLSGSGSDSDGTIASYLWTKISGPSTFNIISPNSAATNISGLIQGVYYFQLTVTDNSGDIGIASVRITVNAAANKPPIANAGSNQTITLPTNSISLSGSGNDADGTIASYQWTKISGPSGYTIATPNSATTNVSGLTQGVYQFQLTVTDNSGDIGTATVQVIVNAAANIPPTANAGSNKSITLPTNSVSLSGSGSDTDGTISTYQWTKISGPSAYTIGTPNSATTNVSGLTQGVYQFQLTVTDNSGDIGADNVQITVNAAPNIPPTADAGSNKSITLPTNSVSLSGSGNDADGTIASYKWTKISGPSGYTIATPNSATTNVTGLTQGVYQFQLIVTDNSGDIGTASLQVTVNAAANIPPTANAGSNMNITLPTNSVSLAGSGSDADGTIASYQWAKISGPSGYTIATPNSATTNVTGLTQGVYQFQLTVTDNSGAKGTSNVQVAVNATPTIPPVADAGSNKAITLPANIVSLAGSGSDADGTIASYQWAKISGPSTFNIVNPTSPVTDVSGLVLGVYQFQLAVTDNDGNIGTDVVRITVNAAANISPTANAGPNKSITLPTNSINLSGSGNDIDGTIASYKWTKISGPSAYNIVSATSPATDVSGLTQGFYQFQLTVTDNNGAIGIATVQVAVNAGANIPPTASAGSNKSITLPANSVNLSGSGNDSDGMIVSYQWTKISGPSSYNIGNPNSASTSVTGLEQGAYQFQLAVTDNSGAIGIATVRVTVNAAANIPPIASAGSNKSITLPTNSVNLSGSGSDADGTIVSYQWTKISGPSAYNIVNASSPVTDVSDLVQGVYNFLLTVTDNNGGKGTSTVRVTVNAAPNIPPTANAGSNKTITLPVNSVSLAGSGNDADGTISTYKWTKISGPSAYNIVNASSPVTDVSGLVQGVYKFQLTVTDNNGDIGVATVQITVNAAANIPPTANAGSNKTITLPANSVSLAGSGSDVDGTIASYQWTKISGPSSYTIASPNSAFTNVTGLVQGVYQFQLTVKDNKESAALSTVQVSVNIDATANFVSPNITPEADAGNDTTIVSPDNAVTLNGKGTDADGNVIRYMWNQISGPSVSMISSNNTAVTRAGNLIEGTYKFELAVTDNKGSVGKDTVSVTVALGRFARVNNNLKVYPNPVHDIATLEINTGKNNTNLLIVITDMSGKVVYRQESVSSLSDAKLQIDMGNLIKGTYVITAFFDGVDKQSIKVLRM